jgi:hypothetical protein
MAYICSQIVRGGKGHPSSFGFHLWGDLVQVVVVVEATPEEGVVSSKYVFAICFSERLQVAQEDGNVFQLLNIFLFCRVGPGIRVEPDVLLDVVKDNSGSRQGEPDISKGHRPRERWVGPHAGGNDKITKECVYRERRRRLLGYEVPPLVLHKKRERHWQAARLHGYPPAAGG